MFDTLWEALASVFTLGNMAVLLGLVSTAIVAYTGIRNFNINRRDVMAGTNVKLSEAFDDSLNRERSLRKALRKANARLKKNGLETVDEE